MAKPTSPSGARSQAPRVWLVGAGPGDPGLITVRGREVLGLADVVLHDALAHPALLRYCPQAELRHVGKRYGEPSPSQEWITGQVVDLARAGKRVVRLKGGDPFLFARGVEELLGLRAAGIRFEVVPGISSPVAASAYAGISLTHRGLSSSVTFVTGTDRNGELHGQEDWTRLARGADTLCILMGMHRIEEICHALMQGGRSPSTPAAVVRWGSRPQQAVATGELSNIASRAKAAGLSSPAVIFVGDVVTLRDQARWWDLQPLFGRRILLFRPEAQGWESAEEVRRRGAEPVLLPTIAIAPAPDPSALTEAVAQLASFHWVLFTSANGVERAFGELAAQKRDARAFGSAKIGAVGKKTADALREHGIEPDRVPDEYVGEALAAELGDVGPSTRILVLRAAEARDALPQALRAQGAEVSVVAAYETVPVPDSAATALRAELALPGAICAFTSSSTVTQLLRLLGNEATLLLQSQTLASIGPITSQTLRKAGLEPTVEASTYTVEGLLDALEEHLTATAAQTPA